MVCVINKFGIPIRQYLPGIQYTVEKQTNDATDTKLRKITTWLNSTDVPLQMMQNNETHSYTSNTVFEMMNMLLFEKSIIFCSN